MDKTINFKRQYHDICRNCGGNDSHCPVCDGMGMVFKSVEGSVTVKSLFDICKNCRYHDVIGCDLNVHPTSDGNCNLFGK